MSELELHRLISWALIATAAATFAALHFVVAPYGRHTRAGWGPTLPDRLGWLIMESPAVVGFVAIFAAGPHRAEVVPLALLGLYQLHYVQRTFVYPALKRAPAARMPIVIAAMGAVFNTLNAYLNARWISALGSYTPSWLTDPRFLGGAALFLVGFVINVTADARLRALRRPGEGGYQIPRGGLYELISCPNYLGEILEWTGWAIATWSLSGLAFCLFTLANLVPRALANHRWYRDQFADYPETRRALVPWVL